MITIFYQYKEINVQEGERGPEKDDCKFKEFEDDKAGDAYIFSRSKNINVLGVLIKSVEFHVGAHQEEEDL